MNIIKKSLSKIDLNDAFFNSLRNDYADVNKWFLEKRRSGYFAYITENENGNITSFLLLKEEKYQDILGIIEKFDLKKMERKNKILKISTFKVINPGKGIGTEYLKIVYKRATEIKASIIYVTVYPKYKEFIKFLENNGFTLCKKIKDDSLKKGKNECDEEIVLIRCYK